MEALDRGAMETHNAIPTLSDGSTGGRIQPQRFHPELNHSSVRVLPPIVVDGNGSGLPKSLSHLHPDLKVDVFNLRTGRLMSGDKAVPVKDLPDLLRYAEYEPVIPPPHTYLHDPNER